MLKQMISLLLGLLFADAGLSAYQLGSGAIGQATAHPMSRLMSESEAAETIDESEANSAASAVGQGDQRLDPNRSAVAGADPDAAEGIEDAAAGNVSKSEARKQQECQMANAAMTAVGVTQNAALQAYVRRVGQRLVAVAEPEG